MITRFIFDTLNDNKKAPFTQSVKQGIMYILKNKGYSSIQIASALGMTTRGIYYGLLKANNMIETNDKLFLNTMKELKEHNFKLNPKYTESRFGRKVITSSTLLVDNIKYKNIWNN